MIDRLNDANGMATTVASESDNIQERIEVHRPHIFRQVLFYVLTKVQDKSSVGETVLQKLLYFIDFDYYEKFEENLMGETYLKRDFGPMNMRLRPELQRLEKEGVIEKNAKGYFGLNQTFHRVVGKVCWGDLTPRDLEHIDGVLDRLSDLNASEISEHSHNDIPWKCTLPGKAIPYESVFYRDDQYSVKEYDDEI